jgi:hypothetical protein
MESSPSEDSAAGTSVTTPSSQLTPSIDARSFLDSFQIKITARVDFGAFVRITPISTVKEESA